MSKDPNAVALGRKGGLATKGITSDAKRAASAANLEKARKARHGKPKKARKNKSRKPIDTTAL